MALTPNKNYNNQTTGSNVNTWGVVNNSNFSIIDLNLGGRLALSVAGSSNVTVTANQAQNLLHILSGVLTGSIQYIFPALGGIYMVENATTGNFTLTIMCAGGSIGALIPQGMRAIVFVNPDDLTVKVDLIGSNYSQGSAASTGSANVQAVATMIPGPYLLIDGALSTWVAGFTCSGSMTLALGGTAAKTSKKLSNAGYVNMASGDVTTGLRYMSVYDKTNDVHVIINPTVTLGTLASMGIGAGLVNDGSGNLTIATSAALPGSPTTTTQAPGDNTTNIATTAFIAAALALKANLASPALTGTPTAPTAAPNTNSTQIATTAYVDAKTAITKGSVLTKDPLVASSRTTQAHGLGSIPNLVIGYIECKTIDQNYAVGDRIPIHQINGGNGANVTVTIYCDPTNIGLIFGTQLPYIGNKTTGTDGAILTASSWKAVLTPCLI